MINFNLKGKFFGQVRTPSELPVIALFLVEDGVCEQVDDVQLDIQSHRDHVSNIITQEHAKALRLLTGNVTVENRDTWPEQREAAQAYNSGRASDDQKELLRDSLKQGETLKSLVANILGKVKINRKLTGLANGVLRRAEDALEKGVDPDEVLATAGKEMEEAKQAFFAAVEAMKAQA